MPYICYIDLVVKLKFSTIKEPFNLLLQLLNPLLLLGGYRNHLLSRHAFQFILTHHNLKIGFIQKDNGLPAADEIHDFPVAFIQWTRAVYHEYDKVRVTGSPPGPVNANLLHHILSIPDTGRVHHVKADSLKIDMLLQRIPGGSGYFSYNGPLLP